MVSPTAQQTRIMEWMENHLPEDNSVGLQDVTSMYTVISVMGPRSRQLMQHITNSDIKMTPYTAQYMNMGYASGVMVFAVTQTNEPGYTLYVQSDHALQLYEQIMKVGQDYNIKDVGLLSVRKARVERSIPSWGEVIRQPSNQTSNVSNSTYLFRN